VSVAVFEVLPLADSFVAVTFPVMTLLLPEVVGVTETLTVQLETALMVMPDKLMVELPEVAVAVPPQLLAVTPPPATVRPETNVVVTATPFSATLALGFERAKLKVEVPFTDVEVGLKEIATVGEATVTVKVAVAVAFRMVTVPVPLVVAAVGVAESEAVALALVATPLWVARFEPFSAMVSVAFTRPPGLVTVTPEDGVLVDPVTPVKALRFESAMPFESLVMPPVRVNEVPAVGVDVLNEAWTAA
jgi:hypothetical protein